MSTTLTSIFINIYFTFTIWVNLRLPRDGPYYAYSKFCLKPFGLWPFQTTKRKIFSRIVTLLAVLTVLIPHITKAYEVRYHFHYLLVCFPSLLYYMHYITKFAYIAIRNDQFRRILEHIKSDFLLYKNNSLSILHDYSGEARKFNTFYTIYLCSTVAIFNGTAFIPHILDLILPLNESRPRNAARLVKYNIRKFDESFYFVLIHGLIFDVVSIAIIIGFDALLINCAQHACALFKIVVFVDNLDSTYAVANFLMIGLSVATVTLTEFETLAHRNFPDIMCRFAFFSTGELLSMLYQNWPGQRVKDHSLRVHASCYECEWYKEDIPIKSRKLLIFMMLKSQTPSCLTAGKLFILDLQNYMKIFKASLSYFAFLSSVQ